jgi:hypothetical protein
MTEQDWPRCTDPVPMLLELRGRSSCRKLRLFALACCRCSWSLISDPSQRRLVEVAERCADGTAAEAELASLPATVAASIRQEDIGDAVRLSAAREVSLRFPLRPGETQNRPSPPDEERGVGVCNRLARAAALAYGHASDAAWIAAFLDLRGQQAALVRHIFGNPFRPMAAAADWPSEVVQLGEALAAREPCHFALHDALLEAGHGALAEHFREPEHPLGCWALDLILGKE